MTLLPVQCPGIILFNTCLFEFSDNIVEFFISKTFEVEAAHDHINRLAKLFGHLFYHPVNTGVTVSGK